MTTHSAVGRPTLKYEVMSGSAMFTMLPISGAMKLPTPTAASARHL